MNILIGADFVPTKSNERLFINANVEKLFGKEILELFSKSDFRVFNLEIPLTDCNEAIRKHGPSLKASKACANLYSRLNINLLTLANNHILDYGNTGLSDTIDVLQENGIGYFGTGSDLTNIKKSSMVVIEGLRVGFYACVEHEFSIAQRDKAGANPFDSIESFEYVKELKDGCDYVIVLYHGGKEEFRYPSPDLQKKCRSFVDYGADLVICQHSHCIGCEEKHKTGTIVYGQGNFLFDLDNNDYWNTNLLINIKDNFEISYIPLIRVGECVRIASDVEKEEILHDFFVRSEEIKRSGFVEENYKIYAQKRFQKYLLDLSGIKRNLLYRIINKISGYKLDKIVIRRKYGLSNLLMMLNYIECETHRELLIEGLKSKISNLSRIDR